MARKSPRRSRLSSIFSVERLFRYREIAKKSKGKRARLGVERLEERTVPTVSIDNGVLRITNDNTVLLRLEASFDSDDVTMRDDLGIFENRGRVTDSSAQPDEVFEIGSFQQIVVTNVGNNAELFLNFSNGNFIPPKGINFNGGTGGNTGLDMFGPPDPFTNETETPFGPTSGQIVFDNNAPIAYSNTTFINDTVPITGTATYQGTASTEALNVVNGPQLTIAGTTFQTTQLNSTNPQMVLPQDTFATINFAQKPNVIIDGLGGNDTYTVNDPATTTANNGLVTLTTGQAADVGDQQVFHVLTPFDTSITYNVVGGIGSNTLIGPDLTNIWDITGTNAGSLGVGIIPAGTVHSFTNIRNLTGGIGDDVFRFEAGGSLTGSIDGGGQGPNGNTIIGDNFGDTYNITGTNAGNIQNLVPAFRNIQNLQGGTGNDTFKFIGTGALTGGIDGGTGGNLIIGNDNDANFVINAPDAGTIAGLLGTKGFGNVGSLKGGLANDTFTFFGGGKLSGTVDGGNAGPVGNTIVGNDNGDVFSITGLNAGTVLDGPNGTLIAGGFTNIENLNGGLGDDIFTFASGGGSLTGAINGGGQGPNGNIIIGDDTGRAYTITGVNAGTVSSLLPGGFTNVQSLRGGKGNDTFQFSGAGALTGGIDGGAGGNLIIGNDNDDTFLINGPDSGTISGLLGTKGFVAIGSLKGGLADDTFKFFGSGKLSGTIDGGNAGPVGNTIVGNDNGDSFSITAFNAGTVSDIPNGVLIAGGFTNIGNLTGGLADDTFTIGAVGTLSGTIDGGGSGPKGNTLVGDNFGDVFTINGVNAGKETTGSAVDCFFANVQNLTGGTGNDTFQFVGAGALTGGIDGGAGGNLIIGNDNDDNFLINGQDSGTISGLLGTKGFKNVGSLQGGLGDDTFTFFGAGKLTGTINGGNAGPNGNTIVGNDNGDNFSITGANAGTVSDIPNGTLIAGGFTNVQNLTGGLASDTFAFSGGSLSGQINGGGEGVTCNQIIGDNTGRTYVIDGPNAGFVSGILPGGFINVGMLVGGSGNNTFTFRNNGSLECGLNGGSGGSNKLIGSDAGESFVINGPNSGFVTGLLFTSGPGGPGTVSGAPFGFMTFTNIGSLQGGLAEDIFTFFAGGTLSGTIDGGNGGPNGNTIVGNDNGDSFTITGTNAGTVSDIPNGALVAGGFTNIENLTGGLADDTFTFQNGGKLSGKIDGGGQSAVGNTIVGDNNGDKFTISGTNAGSVALILPGGFSNIQNLTGGTGNNSFKFYGSGALTGAIDGGMGGNNTIIGNDAGDTFRINGGDPASAAFPAANAGTIDGLLGTGGFVDVQNLQGGLGDDTFIFSIGGSLAGAIDGGGAGAHGNTVVGDDAGDSFVINATNAGNLAETGGAGNLLGVGGFAHIQNLTGGASDDTFVFSAPGKLTGKIDGGGESALGNTIVGDDNGDAWTIKGPNSGSIAAILTSGFSNVENLQGGAGDDTFTFSGAGLLTGFIDGGVGNNTIVGNNFGDHFVINGGFDESGTPDAGYIDGILNGSGSSPNGNGFSNIQNLTGGAGADTFSFLPGGSLDGNINGGNGRDTLDYSQFNLLVTTNLQTKTTTSLGGTFTSLENFVGSPADITNLVGGPPAFDTLIGLNQSSVWAITGPNSGTINLSPVTGAVAGNTYFTFSAYENLTGGTAQDVFRFSPAGLVDGTIDGGGGTDWLDYSRISSGVSVNLSTNRFLVPPGANVLHGINMFGGQASLTGSVANIRNVLGSAGGGDTLIGNGLGNVLVARVGNNTIYGGSGKNIIIGGQGHNLLVGGGSNNLIIAGRTTFDSNITALDAIQNTWTLNPYPVAANAVRQGPNALVVGTTVFLSPAPGPRVGRGGGFYASTVYGGVGKNLIFVRWTSLIVDFNRNRDATVGNP
jgi:hypothetical protein